jgi:hypothetical protein
MQGRLTNRRSISSYVSNPNHWIFHGSKTYVTGLDTFYSHFREEQILVLLTDDLREDTGGCSVGSVITLVSSRIIASISRLGTT